jgi:hypothetical protein
VYLKLANVAESLADKEYVKYFYEMKNQGDATRARGFRTSFLVGFCARIGQRYVDWMEAIKAYYAHDKKALVVLKTSHEKVDEWLEQKNVKKSKVQHKGSSVTNRAGWVRGREKAEEVDLSGHEIVVTSPWYEDATTPTELLRRVAAFYRAWPDEYRLDDEDPSKTIPVMITMGSLMIPLARLRRMLEEEC